MSGLAGILRLDAGKVEPSLLDGMLDRIGHRGPDGRARATCGPVGLAHLMLRTTPGSLHETLPLASPEGDLLLTADARLDNRKELLRVLEIPGEPPDSALILAAYRRWGETCPERLLGDFAFALWDAARQRLFCARDPVGVRPFFYHHQAGRLFAFASEIKALLTLPEVPKRLNETRLADHLGGISTDPAATFYQGIARLPAAHALRVEGDRLALWRTWDARDSPEVRLPSDEAYAEAFLALFREAVRCRLGSALPPGAELSGGLDSPSVVSVARQHLVREGAPPLKTFSAVFPEVPASDESAFIDLVGAQGGLEAHRVRCDRLSPMDNFRSSLVCMDEPSLLPNLFVAWHLLKTVRSEGVRVLLSGSGSEDLQEQRLRDLLDTLLRQGRWREALAQMMGRSRRLGSSPWTLLWRRGVQATLARGRSAGRRLRRDPLSGRAPLIRPEFALRTRLRERLWRRWGAERPWESGKGCLDLLRDDIVPRGMEYTNTACAAFAVEPRYPYYDRRLISFCQGLPPEQKLKEGWDRSILRRAMKGILPEPLRWRQRTLTYGPNFTRAFLEGDRDALRASFPGDLERLAPYLDTTRVRRLYEARGEGVSPKRAGTLWTLIALSRWLDLNGF
jgi:asparagine synthase (glutamine-hydrolysing)